MSTESELIRNAITVLVRETGGEVADRVLPGAAADRDFTIREPGPSLAAARAAQLLGWEAARAVRTHVKYARVDGHSWQQIGEALGYGGRAQQESGQAAAVSAFLLVAPCRTEYDRTLGWTCPACRKVISDCGPETGHPADAEHGHGDGCERLAATIAAWEAEWSDE